MIVGVGIDVVDVTSFAEQLAAPGSAFATGTFRASERRDAREAGAGDEVTRLAARFAAKEAFVKAWSSGAWGRPPRLNHVDPTEVEVVRDAWGRPTLRLHGVVAAAVGALGEVRAHLSLSHDGPVAVATVVLERIASTEATP